MIYPVAVGYAVKIASIPYSIWYSKKKDSPTVCYFILFFNNLATICICGYVYHNNDFKTVYNLLDKLKLKDHKKTIEVILTHSMLNTCAGGCMEELNSNQKDFNLIKFKDAELTMLIKKKEFRHVMCTDCLKIRNLKE